MPKKQTVKKRNPNDATFRNVNSLKKRVAALEVLMSSHIDLLIHVRSRVTDLERRVPVSEPE